MYLLYDDKLFVLGLDGELCEDEFIFVEEDDECIC